MRGACTAERLKKRISSSRPIKECACRFIENSETGIVPLNILFRANAAIGIRRIAPGDKSGKSHPDAIPTQACRRRC
jgi:hypothetical protein